MTIYDDNAVYVGGLPFDANGHTLRRAFYLYGRVVNVKIVKDRATRRNSYGFVAFTNPKSVIDAIDGMNGKNIGGRTVRVNRVTPKDGRGNSGQERFLHNTKRIVDEDKPRHQDRYSDRFRERSRSGDCYRSRHCYGDGERVYGHHRDPGRDNDREKDSFLDRVQDADRIGKVNVNKYSKVSDRDRERDRHLDQDEDREKDQAGTSQLSRKLNSSEEQSSSSRDDHNDRVKPQLERSTHTREELKKEVSHMEDSLKEKQQFTLDLQRESKKLEDVLTDAKKRSSRQQTILTKEYTEKLKNSEKELKALVETAAIECVVTSV